MTALLSPATQSTAADLGRLVAAYCAELAARRALLLEDRLAYETKLADLAALDPHDYTGLARLYREHLRHIDGLLEELDDMATAPAA